MKQEWLVAFKGRNHSGTYDQNFLYRNDSIYVMDNHKAALWCWLQHLSQTGKYDLFHMDRHTDTLNSQTDIWTKHLTDLWTIPLDDYLNRKYKLDGMDFPLMRWDNYLSIFLKMCPSIMNHCIFATHDDGDKPLFANLGAVPIWDVPENLHYWLSSGKHAWIVNVDLDYFCCSKDDKILRMLTDEYITDVFATFGKLVKQNKIVVLTIALSPEQCGGWKESERLCSIATNALGLSFKLP